ncbi:MAG TPA: hypothetical protein VM597_16895 [Gemmataceae bacterium]|nr:hypothetical protein [Gemmataceae bacterium]
MARSTDDDDRRKRRVERDPGYEVLPEDESDEEDDGPRRRRTVREDGGRSRRDEDDRPRRRRTRPAPRSARPFGPPVVRLLGIACTAAAPLMALVCVGGLIVLVMRTGAGAVTVRGVVFQFAMSLVFGAMAGLYARTALQAWGGRAWEIEYQRIALGSGVLGGLGGLCVVPMSLGAIGSTDPSAGMVVTALASVLAVGLMLAIAVLAGLSAAARR